MPNVNQIKAISDRMVEVKTELASKSARDAEFRRNLLSDTKGTIEKEYNLPAGALKDVSIQIVEEKPNTIVVPIPPSAENLELTDDQLEAVAGGVAFGFSVATGLFFSAVIVGTAAGGAATYGVNRGW